jgi:hypothetical protein
MQIIDLSAGETRLRDVLADEEQQVKGRFVS